MATYNAPSTTYNKDEKFAATKLDDALRLIFDEVVVIDNGENSVMAYGWVSKANGLQSISDKAWKFEPQLVAVQIEKKTNTREYNGKSYTNTAYPGGLAFIKQAETVGFGNPFSGVLDGAMDEKCSSIILTGKNEDGTDPTDKELSFVTEYIAPIVVLEKLDKLEGVAIPEGKGGKSGYRGSSSQPESGKLADRVKFMKDMIEKSNADLETVLSSVYKEPFDGDRAAIVRILLENLFS
jgi:hypothetical protein